MRLSAVRLAREIAARLAPVAPPPFSVRAEGIELQILHPDGWSAYQLLDWIDDPSDDRPAAHLAEMVVGNALSGLQDAVSEATHEPWPPISSSGTPRDMALYGTRFDGDRIFFWYGVAEAPVVAFPPIRLSDVLQAPEESSTGRRLSN
jgi:hypothetical protein